IWGHRHQFFTSAHEVSPSVMEGPSDGARGKMKNQDSPVGMSNLFVRHLNLKPFVNPGNSSLRNIEGLRANNPARDLVGDSKNHPSTAFVRQCDAVVHQLFEVVAVRGLLELHVLILGTNRQQRVYILRRGGHGYSTASTTSLTTGIRISPLRSFGRR